jgi:ABC-type sugar transport system ATPase subunit
VSQEPLLRVTKLSKSYGGVRALHDLVLEIARGEVHAICGENGAGKSTLIKLLTGVAIPDSGEMIVDGEPLQCGQVHSSEAAGIAVMHQESTVFPDLNTVDNLFVGREPTYCGGWLLDRGAMRRATCAILKRLGEDLNLDVPVRALSVAQRQIVAMARALSRNCRLLIMDEPTASLSARETATLLNIIRQLRKDGVSVLYVSHRLEEIFQIADRVTVLRDGQHVATRAIGDINSDQLIQFMAGREIDARIHRHDQDPPNRGAQIGEIALEVSQLTRTGVFKNVSFAVRSGEIVGLAGLVGAGRSEIARAVFGLDRYDSGRVLVFQKPLSPGSVRAAMAAGMALVPEDRQHEGLVLPLSVGENISLAMLPTLQRFGFVRRRRERELVDQQMRELMVRATGPRVSASTLSGGNQQKLVLGKWLATRPKVLILDEPTRGIDVGAKAQVHRLIHQLSERGVAVLVISSELAELLALSDRILVLRQGRLVGELSGRTATQDQVLALALPDVQEAVVG